MCPVMKAFLDGVPVADLGAGAEDDLRADIEDDQRVTRKLLAAWDDIVQQIGNLSLSMDAKGRAYASEWNPNEALRSGLFHVGWAYSRAQQSIAHIGNLMREKAWRASP